jgi:voltage-gated potassium channel
MIRPHDPAEVRIGSARCYASGMAARSSAETRVSGGTISAVADVAASRHARMWLVAVLSVIVIGSAGYAVLFAWSVSDAVYMTVITLTTVGFHEVREINDPALRLWTMLLAVAGVAIIFGTVGIVAETILSEATSGRREARRMREAVGALRDHYIVCGYGRVGSTVARELVHAGARLVVIDILAASLERAARDGLLVVEGDATDDATLRAAGVTAARGLITTIDSDANNVYVTLSARGLNPRLFIVARANAQGSEAKLLQAGANRVVSPYTMAGRRIAELASRPRVVDFIDAALSHGNLSFSLEEVEVDAESPLLGTTVGSLRSEGVVTLAILQPSGAYEANPPEGRGLRAGESVIASGSTEALAALRARA